MMLYLAGKVAILASQVGFLDMQVEEIEVVPVFFQGGEFIRQRVPLDRQNLHADQFGDAAIGGIAPQWRQRATQTIPESDGKCGYLSKPRKSSMLAGGFGV